MEPTLEGAITTLAWTAVGAAALAVTAGAAYTARLLRKWRADDEFRGADEADEPIE